MAEAAAEAQAETAETHREARDLRLAVYGSADTDGDAVDALADKLDRADGRQREDVVCKVLGKRK